MLRTKRRFDLNVELSFILCGNELFADERCDEEAPDEHPDCGKHDQHSLFDADPMLTLSDVGNSRLNISMDDASPALRPEIGFRRWDWTRVGPRVRVSQEARSNDK